MIIYSGFYGNAKKTAEILGSILGQPVKEAGTGLNLEDRNEPVIVVSSLYAGKPARCSKIMKDLNGQNLNKIYVVTVGAMDPEDPKLAAKIKADMETVFKDFSVQVYSLQGNLDYAKLNPVHRMMMFGLKTFLQKKKNLDASSEMIVKTYGGSIGELNTDKIFQIAQKLKKDITKQR